MTLQPDSVHWRCHCEAFNFLRNRTEPEADLELIDGTVNKAMCVPIEERALNAIKDAFGPPFTFQAHASLPLSEFDQPMASFAVLIGHPIFFEQRDPNPNEIALVVDCVDSYPDFHRTKRVAIFARAGVGEYWLVDRVHGILEFYRSPLPDLATYRQRTILLDGESVKPLLVEGKSFDTGLFIQH